MEKLSGLGLIVSIIIHALIGLLIFWPEQEQKKSTEVPTAIEWVEIKPKESPQPKKKKLKSGAKKAGPKSGKNQRQAILNSLSPSHYNAGTFEEHQSSRNQDWYGDEIIDTMQGMELNEYTGNRNFFEALSSKINWATPFPKELAEHKIDGKVWIKIKVSRKGELLQVIDFSQSNPTLQAYVLICLYRALKTPLSNRAWYDEDKDMDIFLNFDFQVISIRQIDGVQSVRYYKNRFEFERIVQIPNFMEQGLQEYARYIPPIIPTPMGPIVNFVQLYHFINAWAGDDPVVQKRNLLRTTKQRLEEILEMSRQKHLYEPRQKTAPFRQIKPQ